MLSFDFTQKKPTYWYRNLFCVSFILIFIGYLSLSFWGFDFRFFRILSIVAIAGFVIANVNRLSAIYKDPLVRNYALFVICCYPSFMFSQDKGTCLFKLMETTMVPSLIALGVYYFSVKKVRNVFFFLTWYFVIQTLITMYGYFTDPSVLAVDTGYGTYVTSLRCKYPPLHPNALGSYGAISAFFSLTCFVRSNKIINKVIFGGLFVMSIAMVYLTSSRTSMISGFIGLIFLSFVLFNFSKKLLLVFVIAGFAYFYHGTIEETVTGIMMKKRTEKQIYQAEDKTDLIMSGRLSIWEEILKKPKNCILGLGYGTAVKQIVGDENATNAHNSIIEILINAGIFALFFWLRMWWLIFTSYRKLCRQKQKLPLNICWYHLAMAMCVMAFLRSFGNISAVYMMLDLFGPIAAMVLFIWTDFYLSQRKVPAEVPVE